MNRKIFSLVLLLIAMLVHVSCDKQMVFNEFQRIDNGSWGWDEPVNFSFSIEDTVTLHDLQIQLRHTTEYPLSNLYMFVHVEGPSGQRMNDTIQFILAENSGKWIGKGIGNIREIGYLYRKNTVFPDTGMYSVSIEQAMRLPEVPVAEIGLRIRRANP
jgi:gliding motility-associated lipoprotein GldH